MLRYATDMTDDSKFLAAKQKLADDVRGHLKGMAEDIEALAKIGKDVETRLDADDLTYFYADSLREDCERAAKQAWEHFERIHHYLREFEEAEKEAEDSDDLNADDETDSDETDSTEDGKEG